MPPKIELLAPAGDFECLEFALAYGADAVYLAGSRYGMRSACANFTPEALCQAVALAHGLGKRVYLTLNTLPRNSELEGMPAAIRQAAQAGVDAFIVADLGVLELVRSHAPGAEVHFSTQAGICNHAAATAAWRLGASRVILARELSLAEIAEIRERTPAALELEAFVHGAMCMSVSGRCLLSGTMAGRDANRGRCAQPCRWKYSLVEEKRPGEYLPVLEDDEGSYILSADDLCAAPFLDRLLEAGVTSLKIEGRAKSFYYVAAVTAAYRAALAAGEAGVPYAVPAFAQGEFERVSHRPYSSGFYLGRAGATQSPQVGEYIREWQPVGVVEAQREGRVFARQCGRFAAGDALEALLPEGRVVALVPQDLQDEAGRPIKATPHTQMRYSFLLPAGEALPERTILRKRAEP